PGRKPPCRPSSPRTRAGGCCTGRFLRVRPCSCGWRGVATRTSTPCWRFLASPPDLEGRLRDRLRTGGRAFVPYVTGGLPGVDEELLRGLDRAQADAIEVGIPFSDPVMDGPVIQEASARALEAGATLEGIVGEVGSMDLAAP